MRLLIVAGAGLLLGGCVANTMGSFVGQDIRAVEVAYGPPANQVDLGGGARAYQWRKVSVDTTPVTEVTTERRKRGRKTWTTETTGGDTTVTNCLYTFMTSWNAGRGGWIVTGFRQPSLECAVGDLSLVRPGDAEPRPGPGLFSERS